MICKLLNDMQLPFAFTAKGRMIESLMVVSEEPTVYIVCSEHEVELEKSVIEKDGYSCGVLAEHRGQVVLWAGNKPADYLPSYIKSQIAALSAPNQINIAGLESVSLYLDRVSIETGSSELRHAAGLIKSYLHETSGKIRQRPIAGWRDEWDRNPVFQ